MINELKKALKEQKLVYGTKETLKNLKLGKTKVVFVSSNAPEEVVEDIDRYAKLANAKVIKLEVNDSEIGMICKRLHPVSVLSY